MSFWGFLAKEKNIAQFGLHFMKLSAGLMEGPEWKLLPSKTYQQSSSIISSTTNRARDTRLKLF